jgi:lysophospholipid hydrolase
MAMKQHGTFSSDRARPQWLTTQGRKMTENSISMLNNVKDQLEKYYSAVPTFGRLLVMNKKRGNALTSVDTLSRNDFAR